MPQKLYNKKSKQAASKEKLEGYLHRIVYYSKNSWGVFEFELQDKTKIKCTGNLASPNVGSLYQLTGEHTFNEKFNEKQFKFTEGQQLTDNSQRGIIKLLTSTLHGIGPATAQKIYTELGENCIEIIREYPEKFRAVFNRFSERQCEEFSEKLQSIHGFTELKKKLYSVGLTDFLIEKIHGRFGAKTLELLKSSPFEVTSIAGIGFKKASGIADAFGLPSNDPGRIRAAILYIVKTLQDTEGHTCIDEEKLIKATQEILMCSPEEIQREIQVLISYRQLLTSLMEYEPEVPYIEQNVFEEEELEFIEMGMSE